MREAVYRFGDVTVEPAGREVRRAGARVPLEPKALDVLLLLLAEPGRVVDKRRLLKEVWADVHVTDSSLARAVTQIRRALGDDHKTPRYVETVPTRGYRFIGTLEPLTAPSAVLSPSGALPHSPEPAANGPAGLTGIRTRLAWVGAAAMAVLLAGLGWAGLDRRTTKASMSLGGTIVWAASAVAVQLTTTRGADVDPAWSPDGMQIAYASDESGALEIYVRPRGGDAPARAVTSNGGDNVSPAWSSDGQWLAYHSRRLGGVWIVRVAGGPPRQLAAEGSSPAWSPDGRSVALQTAAEPDLLGGSGATVSTLAVVDVATGALRPVTERGRPAGSHGRPVWLPDGLGLAFIVASVPAADIWIAPPSGDPVRVGACSPSSRPFVFRRHGRPYLGLVDGAMRGRFWMLPLDGPLVETRAETVPLPTTVSLSDLIVSPDGRHVAYSSASRVSELWSVPITSADPFTVSTPRAVLHERRPRYGEPAFSRDGSRLAFTTLRAGGGAEAWVYDVKAGRTERLASATTGFVKGWTPDGKLLMIDPSRRTELASVDIVTGRSTRVLDFGAWPRSPDTAHRLFTVRPSPDLRRFVYATIDGARTILELQAVGATAPSGRVEGPGDGADFPVWSHDGARIAFQAAKGWRTRAAVLDVSTSRTRLLETGADHVWVHDWSADGRRILAAAMRQGRWTIDVIDADTGATRSITPPTPPAGYVRYPVWAPSGDGVLYEQGSWNGNVWVADVPDR
jgi:Tol biopolymer transport system component/DNA-binding winged helix-turn-helix (wHTH) protein